MLIRKATMNDIETLRAMYLELEQDAVKYQPEHFVIGYRDNDFFEKIFNSENQDILVAEMDSEVVGFSHVMILQQKNVACLKPQTLVYIQDLDVIAEMRSQGIGSLLMKASKEYGIANGAEFIRTQVFPQNVSGMKFYAQNGFIEMMKTIECQLAPQNSDRDN